MNALVMVNANQDLASAKAVGLVRTAPSEHVKTLVLVMEPVNHLPLLASVLKVTWVRTVQSKNVKTTALNMASVWKDNVTATPTSLAKIAPTHPVLMVVQEMDAVSQENVSVMIIILVKIALILLVIAATEEGVLKTKNVYATLVFTEKDVRKLFARIIVI